MIESGQHVFISGISGSGKSTLTRKIADLSERRIVFDRLGEWHSPDPALVFHDYHQFQALYRVQHVNAAFTLLYRPRRGISPEDLFQEVEAILALVHSVESSARAGIALVMEEVWLYAPTYSIGPWFQEIALTGRHFGISVIANAQRPANVAKTFVSQCRHVFIGQYFEQRDHIYYRETLGDLPELRKPIPRFNFLWFRPDMYESERTQMITVTPNA